MSNFLKKSKKLEVNSNDIVKEIHETFDTAADRLLKEAKEHLEELHKKQIVDISSTHYTEVRAERLKKLGFTNVPTIHKSKQIAEERRVAIETRNLHNKNILTLNQRMDLIDYYAKTYPFQKFLTVSELDRICQKYGLIYAPSHNFINDIPEKNLVEIENSKTLLLTDVERGNYIVEINSFYVGVPEELKAHLKGKITYTGQYDKDSNIVNDGSWFKIYAQSKGWHGNHYGNCIINTASVVEQSKKGLFVAAPKNYFSNINELSKTSKFGYVNQKKTIVHDPVVFRYCRGGIQVLSKWGPEAEIPELLNPIEN